MVIKFGMHFLSVFFGMDLSLPIYERYYLIFTKFVPDLAIISLGIVSFIHNIALRFSDPLSLPEQ
ncbi:hypothetical protein JCM10550A_02030 [Methanogenium cariaci]